MKRLWRSIRLVIEVGVALALFFIIVKNTPLFDRALPDRDPIPTHTNTTSTTTSTLTEGQVVSSGTLASSGAMLSGMTTTLPDSSHAQKIVYMPGLGPVVTNMPADTQLNTPVLMTSTHVVERPLSVERSCTTPWGVRLADGDTTIAYQAIKVDANDRCIGEIRSCRDGRLGGSYRYETCAGVSNGTIQLPDATVLEVSPGATDDTQRLIDLSNYLTWRETYTYERTTQPDANNDPLTLAQARPQTMTNADLVTTNPSPGDVLDQVTVRDPRYISQRSCRTPRGERVRHGEYVYAFERQTGRLGQYCTVQKRACIDGDLFGTYRYETCTYLPGVSNPLALTTLPNTFNYGTRFTRAPYVIPFEDNLGRVNIAGGSTSLPPNFISPPPVHNYASCRTPRGSTIEHNQTITAYRLPYRTANSLCDPQVRRCRDGELSGTYGYQTCRNDTRPLRSPSRRWQPWTWW